MITKIEYEFDGMGKVKYITDNEIHFNECLIVEFFHDSDCCENNFADLTALNDTTFMTDEFKTLIIETCEYGYRVNGYFVPCYSIQNGYYSEEVTCSLKNYKVLATLSTTAKFGYE